MKILVTKSGRPVFIEREVQSRKNNKFTRIGWILMQDGTRSPASWTKEGFFKGQDDPCEWDIVEMELKEVR